MISLSLEKKLLSLYTDLYKQMYPKNYKKELRRYRSRRAYLKEFYRLARELQGMITPDEAKDIIFNIKLQRGQPIEDVLEMLDMIGDNEAYLLLAQEIIRNELNLFLP